MKLFQIIAAITVVVAVALIVEAIKCEINQQNPAPWWVLSLILMAALIIVGAFFQ